jgi:putative copper resistance protein D
MDNALVACRAVQFMSAMLAFGGAAFRLYAVDRGDPDALAAFDRRLRGLLLISALAALLSGLVLVPIIGGTMAGSSRAALDWRTMAEVLLRTSFGRVWRWHLFAAALLVVVCAVRSVRPGYAVVPAALSLASLGWVGHAMIGEGRIGSAYGINQSVHLLAGGLWLGGLVPLAALVVRATRPASKPCFAVMRVALLRFSWMGYFAVALVALTGIVNTAMLVGGVRGLIGTPYGRLLLAKIALFLLMVGLAVVNRFVLVPRIAREGKPMVGMAALRWTIAIEQALGLAIIVVVSVLGTWPPAIHLHTPVHLHTN